jgi:hypothetical protein
VKLSAGKEAHQSCRKAVFMYTARLDFQTPSALERM